MTHFVDTLSMAHETAIRQILLHGNHITTENNEETLELPYAFHIVITNPHGSPQISPGFTKYKHNFLDNYADKVIAITPPRHDGQDASYTYGNRLRNYSGIDQLTKVIDNLSKSPLTRRAIMHTWMVATDIVSSEPPCMQTVQFTIRDNKLNTSVTFRSNDMLMAYGANLYAILKLAMIVESKLNIRMGIIETYSCCPHIYFKRDKDELGEMRQWLNM